MSFGHSYYKYVNPYMLSYILSTKIYVGCINYIQMHIGQVFILEANSMHPDQVQSDLDPYYYQNASSDEQADGNFHDWQEEG